MLMQFKSAHKEHSGSVEVEFGPSRLLTDQWVVRQKTFSGASDLVYPPLILLDKSWTRCPKHYEPLTDCGLSGTDFLDNDNLFADGKSFIKRLLHGKDGVTLQSSAYGSNEQAYGPPGCNLGGFGTT